MPVFSKDQGYKDLLQRVRECKTGFVEVGILTGEAEATHDGKLTVLDVAEMNEFGLGVPERSFIRAFFDEYEQEAIQILQNILSTLVQRKITKKQALMQVGLLLVAKCQARIRAHIDPPNSKITEQRKGSSTPLIDTGQLVSSITFRTSFGDTSKTAVAAREREIKRSTAIKKPSAGLIEKAEKLAAKPEKKVLRATRKVERAAKRSEKAVKRTIKTAKRTVKAASKQAKKLARAAKKGLKNGLKKQPRRRKKP